MVAAMSKRFVECRFKKKKVSGMLCVLVWGNANSPLGAKAELKLWYLVAIYFFYIKRIAFKFMNYLFLNKQRPLGAAGKFSSTVEGIQPLVPTKGSVAVSTVSASICPCLTTLCVSFVICR